jgi:hypothetical protein
MIPVVNFPETALEPQEQPSLTYRLDTVNKRVQGKIDGLGAIHQAVMKILQTERFAFEIYNDQYGFEFESLIGQNREYVKEAIKQRLTEAITADDRIISVDNITVTNRDSDSLHISFELATTFGALSMDMGVNV